MLLNQRVGCKILIPLELSRCYYFVKDLMRGEYGRRLGDWSQGNSWIVSVIPGLYFDRAVQIQQLLAFPLTSKLPRTRVILFQKLHLEASPPAWHHSSSLTLEDYPCEAKRSPLDWL